MTEDSTDKKINLTKIEWIEKNSSLQKKDLHLLDQLPYPLPELYIDLNFFPKSY